MTYRQQEQLKPKKTLKEANQQLSACLQLVIHVFIDSGVSPASMNQLHQAILCHEVSHHVVLERCQHYMDCIVSIKSKESCCLLLLHAWQALVKRDAIQRRTVFQQLIDMMSDEYTTTGSTSTTTITSTATKLACRKLAIQLQQCTESYAESQLGLYRIHSMYYTNKRDPS